MAQGYRLIVEQPATSARGAKTWEWGHASGVVVSIQVETHLDGKRIGTLTAIIHDPPAAGKWWPIAGQLPDPAFQNIPVKLYLSPPDKPQGQSTLVFDGKLTTLEPGYPTANLTIVAHDKSIDARKQKRAKTFAGKTALQVVQALAKDYDLTLDYDTADVADLKNRIIDIARGKRFSDWDQMYRALAFEGLSLYMKGSTIKILRKATTVYPTKLIPGQPPLISLSVAIQHIRGPGQGGDSKLLVLQDQSTGAVLSARGGQSREAAKEGASAVVTEMPPVGPTMDTTGAHSEDRENHLANAAASMRRRKDTLSATCTALPDLQPFHTLAVDGFGAKADGTWYPQTIGHFVIGGQEYAKTTIGAARGPSAGAAKETGVAFTS